MMGYQALLHNTVEILITTDVYEVVHPLLAYMHHHHYHQTSSTQGNR